MTRCGETGSALVVAISSAFALFVAGTAAHSDPQHPVVATQQGPIQGDAANGVAKFLGIPYAAPPVGDLRWRPPVPHAPWRSVLQTTSYGPRCPQGGAPNTSEDCLQLNVFAPSDAVQSASSQAEGENKKGPGPGEKNKKGPGLPVMFWIFGGGLEQGSPDGYDGSALASQGRTIVVTVNYRLNVFGFLLDPALRTNGHVYGDYGLLDQQFGMKWVQQNIAEFGGDPNNVTIFGESGGSHGVGGNVLSPLAKGLFQHAIMESGDVDFWHTPHQTALTSGINFAVAVGCGSGSDAATAACLRALPAATVEANNGAAISSLPLVDGEVVPLEPVAAVTSGQFNHVSIMIGNNRDEYAWVVAGSPTAPTENGFINYMTSRFSGNAGPSGSPPAYPAGTVQKVLAEYPLSAYASVYDQYIRAGSDGGWPVPICGIRHFTELLADKVPTYEYEFRDRTLPVFSQPSWVVQAGAYHTAELNYIFPGWTGLTGLNTPLVLNPAQKKLSDQMISLWTNFARTGNPNENGNAPWPRYKGHGANPQIYGLDIKPAGLTKISDAQFSADHHCQFWDGVLVYSPIFPGQ
jgi:para-nitrobenzyl esterase